MSGVLEARRRLLTREPETSNAEWARRWGMSRERVRQIRSQLGLSPPARPKAEPKADGDRRSRFHGYTPSQHGRLVRIAVYLEPQIAERLIREAEEKGQSVSQAMAGYVERSFRRRG